MANQQQNPISGNPAHGIKENEEARKKHGGDRSQTQNEGGTREAEEKTPMPGEQDNAAARGADKSVNGDEFDRQGRNPKPFSVS